MRPARKDSNLTALKINQEKVIYYKYIFSIFVLYCVGGLDSELHFFASQFWFFLLNLAKCQRIIYFAHIMSRETEMERGEVGKVGKVMDENGTFMVTLRY